MVVGNYTPAELRVRLRYQPLYGAYTFDTYQYMTDNKFRDAYPNITQAKDLSLFSTYPFMATQNMSSYYHWVTSIYLPYNALGKQPIFYTNATGNFTKGDYLYFQLLE